MEKGNALKFLYIGGLVFVVLAGIAVAGYTWTKEPWSTGKNYTTGDTVTADSLNELRTAIDKTFEELQKISAYYSIQGNNITFLKVIKVLNSPTAA